MSKKYNGSSSAKSIIRCAIYTRKSTEDGLNQELNSLDVQRETCERTILNRAGEGFVVIPEHYDDGGYSGGNMERPALQRLLADSAAGKIDCAVVYKVDRFSRSLLQFMTMLERLQEHGVTFISVTQPFETATPAGRLVLNILMMFAQFEREMISERTRDKMHAARSKGKWTGGNLVLGYDLAPGGGKLVTNAEEAKRVQQIFDLYLEMGALRPVLDELERRGWQMKAWTGKRGQPRGGAPFQKSTLHNLLTHPIYKGQVRSKEGLVQGEHPAIVDEDCWNRVQAQLKRNIPGPKVRNKNQAMLGGIVYCDSCDCRMTPSYTKKKDGIVYRYYVCRKAHQRGWNACETRAVSAAELEGAVLNQLRKLIQSPEMLASVLRHLLEASNATWNLAVDIDAVRAELMKFDSLWNHLKAWEQGQFIRQLIQEVRYHRPTQSVTLAFRCPGILKLVQPELSA